MTFTPRSSMPQIQNRLEAVLAKLPGNVKLVAVSKFHPATQLQAAYDAGQRRFGESRADELAEKAVSLPADIEWHFIGHLQTNKIRRVVKYASMIESVDSERLLRLISAESERTGKTIDILLQVHVAAEESKTGFIPEELLQCAANCAALPAVKIRGIMGMATNTDDSNRITADFNAIAAIGSKLRELIPEATEISMGMSGDWPQAVSCGATMVRIGSAIFGEREPQKQ